MDVKEIYDKYGEMCFRIAIAHLYDKGMCFFKNTDLNKIIDEIDESLKDNAILSKDVQIQINRCASELAEIDVWDILKFVKTDLDVDGITVHQGKILSFKENCTDIEKARFLISNHTDEEEISLAKSILEEEMLHYETEYGDFSEFDYMDAINECLCVAGIQIMDTSPDYTIYL